MHRNIYGIIPPTPQLDDLLIYSEQPIQIKLTGFRISAFGDAFMFSVMSVCPSPESYEKYYRGKVAPSIWEELSVGRGYSERKTKLLCGSPVDIWSASVVCF